MLTFPSTTRPNTCAPVAKPRAWLWRASESQPSSSEPGTQLTDFLQNPQNPPRALPMHDDIHIHWSTFLSRIFHFDNCERHILPVRELTPALKFASN